MTHYQHCTRKELSLPAGSLEKKTVRTRTRLSLTYRFYVEVIAKWLILSHSLSLESESKSALGSLPLIPRQLHDYVKSI